jgi:sodium-dependent dicarboxylate transporter 2/3/5
MLLIPVSLRPGRLLVDWRTASKIPWEIILLFGGGLCLSDGIQRAGLDRHLIGLSGGLQNVPHWVVLCTLVVVCLALSEVASNTAAAALMLPLAGALAESMGEHPVYLMLPVALATSLGFMMPVATPPNALALATGETSVRDLMKAGFVLNVIGAVLIVVGAYVLGFRAYGAK